MCVMRTPEITLRTSQVYSTSLLTIVTMLCIESPEHILIENLYLLTLSSFPTSKALLTTILVSVAVSLTF